MWRNAVLMQHFKHPRHVGCFASEMPDVLVAEAFVPASLDSLRLSVQRSTDDPKTVIAVRFQAQGSPYLIAVGDWVAGQLNRKTADDLARLTVMDVITALNLPNIKYYCAVLAIDAVSEIIHQMKSANVSSV